ncbi:MAG: methyltransferase domain-containing protein [Actinobacteria bacterium]|nr:MAG: methyltransferase domain-containing protein [Actinomycetota bacterium]
MPDRWATWLTERRFGGSEEARRESQAMFDAFRRRVVEGARIGPGDTVLDVGCGEGLIGFGALELVGDGGTVVFTDVSEDVLNVCREIADGDPRCAFVRASADELPFDDESVDVVTTRSTLIYLHDKPQTLLEFFRVLRGGGRLSMFEPVNSFGWPEPDGLFSGYDVADVWGVAQKLQGCFSAHTLVGWDERDLLSWVEAAGFRDVELTYELEVKPHPMAQTRDWDTFRSFAPNSRSGSSPTCARWWSVARAPTAWRLRTYVPSRPDAEHESLSLFDAMRAGVADRERELTRGLQICAWNRRDEEPARRRELHDAAVLEVELDGRDGRSRMPDDEQIASRWLHEVDIDPRSGRSQLEAASGCFSGAEPDAPAANALSGASDLHGRSHAVRSCYVADRAKSVERDLRAKVESKCLDGGNASARVVTDEAQRELRLRDARREQIVAKRHGKPLTVRVEDRQADDAVRRGARHGCGLDAAATRRDDVEGSIRERPSGRPAPLDDEQPVRPVEADDCVAEWIRLHEAGRWGDKVRSCVRIEVESVARETSLLATCGPADGRMSDRRLNATGSARSAARSPEREEISERRSQRDRHARPVRRVGGEGEHAVARVRLVLDPEVRVAADYGLVQAVHRSHLDLRDAVGGDAERELGALARATVLESEVAVHDDDR